MTLFLNLRSMAVLSGARLSVASESIRFFRLKFRREAKYVCGSQARLSGEAARTRAKCANERRSGKNKKVVPPQSPRTFPALARLYYLAHPTKTAMLRRLLLSMKMI